MVCCMKQQSFCDIEYSNRRRKTKREEFLDSMNEIIPWDQWIEFIRPYYYSNKRGRRPKDIEVMLRMYLMQNWFNLSDEGIEEAIYDSYAMRSFLGINFIDEQVPDATTLLKFRHLLEKHHIGEKIFKDVSDRLEKAGLIMHGGSIVDATIIAAPSSTKNKEGKRDPEMHQTKKGNQWYHGMKVHAGVDAGSGYVHTITGTAANVHDIDETVNLLREDDEWSIIRSYNSLMPSSSTSLKPLFTHSDNSYSPWAVGIKFMYSVFALRFPVLVISYPTVFALPIIEPVGLYFPVIRTPPDFLRCV